MALSFVTGKHLVIVLDEENLERIQQADPFEMDMAKMGTYSMEFPFKVHICFARKDDAKFNELIEQKDVDGLLKYLSRGFKVTASDHDRGYEKYATLKAGGKK